MAFATPSGDTLVGSDVAMTDRDQPSTATLERTMSGLKRLHNGEVKRPQSDTGRADVVDTAGDPDQVAAVIKSGAKAAAAEGGGGGGGGSQSQVGVVSR
jgi:hypothetical protein